MTALLITFAVPPALIYLGLVLLARHDRKRAMRERTDRLIARLHD